MSETSEPAPQDTLPPTKPHPIPAKTHFLIVPLPMGVPEVDWIALYVSVSLHDYMKACRTPIKEIFKNMNYLIIVIYLESHLVGFFLL